MQALTVTTFGGLAMLAGMVMLGEAAGTYRISGSSPTRPAGGMVAAAVVLILAGALSKSAIFPFSIVAAGRDGRADPGLAPTCTRRRW